MKIVLAGDHYTVELMTQIKQLLDDRNIEYIDLGSKSESDKQALMTIIPAVTNEVVSNQADIGILACGTGVGVEIGANRIKGIRASLCRDAEQAKNSRIYDNSNVLCLGAWYKDDFSAIVSAWLDSEFDGDEKRTQMLKDFDTL